jgi:hypothetical protein
VENLSDENYLRCEKDPYSRHFLPYETTPDITLLLPSRTIPLIDAVYSSIVMAERTLERVRDQTKVVFCMHVDGMEGCSTHHTWGKLRATVDSALRFARPQERDRLAPWAIGASARPSARRPR